MFIFFGNYARVLEDVKLTQACTSCKRDGLFATFIQNYFSIFWIPMFPTGKDVYITCDNCGAMFDPAKVSIARSEIERLTPKTPKWTFAGLIVIVLVIGAGFIFASIEEQQELENTKTYQAAPLKNDLYLVELKKPEDGYTIYKLESVKRSETGEIIEYSFQGSEWYYEDFYDTKDAATSSAVEEKDYFISEVLTLSADEFNKFKIKQILRPEAALEKQE